jgi:hypothetical protein
MKLTFQALLCYNQSVELCLAAPERPCQARWLRAQAKNAEELVIGSSARRFLEHIPKFCKWRNESQNTDLVHIPKFRNGAEKILANALTPDFFGASDIILGYAPNA